MSLWLMMRYPHSWKTFSVVPVLCCPVTTRLDFLSVLGIGTNWSIGTLHRGVGFTNLWGGAQCTSMCPVEAGVGVVIPWTFLCHPELSTPADLTCDLALIFQACSQDKLCVWGGAELIVETAPAAV